MTLRRIKLPTPLTNQPVGSRNRLRQRAVIALIVIFCLGLIGYLMVGRPVLATIGAAKEARAKAQEIYAAAKRQDLEQVKAGLPELKASLTRLENEFNRLAWLRFTPVIAGYWQDGRHLIKAGQHGVEAGIILTESLTPYADILGLEAGGSFSDKSAEERIQTVVGTIDKLIPDLDRFGQQFTLIKGELDQINLEKYPERVRGKPVKSRLIEFRARLDRAEELFVQVNPLIRYLPAILGQSTPQKYLVLFQNNAEIRPTGGFLTAYAIFVVDKGKIRAEKSEDIYILDQSVTRIFPLPEPIKLSPLKVTSWRLRDANLSPDFVVSMEQFSKMYRYARRGQEVDGIIAIDTTILVNILKVLGPISASGIEFSADHDPDCNCPKVIYELEKIVDTPVAFERSGRKDILGVLMLSLMQKGLQSSPSHVWPVMLRTFLTNLKEKHILLRFNDPKIQEAVERVGFAGRIRPFAGDYLHVNDTNFGGAKSNLYIKESVSQKYQIASDGTISKEVTVEYLNPEPWSDCNLESGELCLNGEAPIWVRLYVPQGSRLIKATGSDRKVVGTEDLGKTVFGGWLKVRPEGTASFTVTYQLPFKLGDGLKLLIQKQPGKEEEVHRIKINDGKEKTYPVRSDLEIDLNSHGHLSR